MTALVHDQQRDERILLRELNHRMDNELAAAINVVCAAALRADNPDVKLALGRVVELLEKRADVHRALAMPRRDGLIDAAEHIRKLGFVMSRSWLEPLGIRLELSADTLPLESQRCWRLALMVHELVMNVAKHASFEGRDGAVKIGFSLTDAGITCIVADNGSRSGRLKPGAGLRIVSELAKDLGGHIGYGLGEQFSSVVLVFPMTEREQRANRAIALRRAREARLRKLAAPLSQPRAKRRVGRTESPQRESRAT